MSDIRTYLVQAVIPREFTVTLAENPGEVVITNLTPCFVCSEHAHVIAPVEGATRYLLDGAFAQDAFPSMSVDDRECLISGIHASCF